MATFSRSTQASRAGTRGTVVEGLDETVAMFTRKADRIRPEAAKVVVKSADSAAQRMRNTVPIGPPTLHVLNSITSDQKATTTGTSVHADAGPDPAADEGAFVARFLEHGTVKMAPQPFVGPAGDATIPELERDLKGLL